MFPHLTTPESRVIALAKQRHAELAAKGAGQLVLSALNMVATATPEAVTGVLAAVHTQILDARRKGGKAPKVAAAEIKQLRSQLADARVGAHGPASPLTIACDRLDELAEQFYAARTAVADAVPAAAAEMARRHHPTATLLELVDTSECGEGPDFTPSRLLDGAGATLWSLESDDESGAPSTVYDDLWSVTRLIRPIDLTRTRDDDVRAIAFPNAAST